MTINQVIAFCLVAVLIGFLVVVALMAVQAIDLIKKTKTLVGVGQDTVEDVKGKADELTDGAMTAVNGVIADSSIGVKAVAVAGAGLTAFNLCSSTVRSILRTVGILPKVSKREKRKIAKAARAEQKKTAKIADAQQKKAARIAGAAQKKAAKIEAKQSKAAAKIQKKTNKAAAKQAARAAAADAKANKAAKKAEKKLSKKLSKQNKKTAAKAKKTAKRVAAKTAKMAAKKNNKTE